MGCNNSQGLHDKHTIENQKLGQYERSLCFHKHSIADYEIIIRRLSNSPVPVEIALSRFQSALNFEFPKEFKEALQALFDVAGNIDSRKLLVFSILFGKGSEDNKAEALWYAFDKGAVETMPIASIKEMLKTIIQSSVNVTLEAAIKSEYFNVNRFLTYKSNLAERMSSLETKLVKHYLHDQQSLSKIDFLAKIKMRPDGLITDPHNVRAMIELTQIIPNKFANPFKTMKLTKLTTT